MKQGSGLQRRSWLALAAWTLTGCGGGGSGGTAANPGTGGTGVYAVGSISGFGSVILNGIKFDDLQATVQVDGVTALSADLRLGMVASVQGQRDTVDTTLGTARSIEVWSIAQGRVTPVNSSQFTLSGMRIQTDSATVFYGISSAATLTADLFVTVWGLQSGTGGSLWTATRVAVVPAAQGVSTGVVTMMESRPVLNGLLLTGEKAGSLAAGQLVRVQGALSAAGDSLQVQSLKLQGSSVQPQGESEIEGIVTQVFSASRFMLGSIEVDASAAYFKPPTTQIAAGLRVEVEGIWQAGVLKARTVEVKDSAVLESAEISAPIEQFTSLADFVVRGQRCAGSAQTVISHGSVANLKVGVQVSLKGTISGDVLRVTELEIEN
jgi:hypothetical protein